MTGREKEETYSNSKPSRPEQSTKIEKNNNKKQYQSDIVNHFEGINESCVSKNCQPFISPAYCDGPVSGRAVWEWQSFSVADC